MAWRETGKHIAKEGEGGGSCTPPAPKRRLRTTLSFAVFFTSALRQWCPLHAPQKGSSHVCHIKPASRQQTRKHMHAHSGREREAHPMRRHFQGRQVPRTPRRKTSATAARMHRDADGAVPRICRPATSRAARRSAGCSAPWGVGRNDQGESCLRRRAHLDLKRGVGDVAHHAALVVSVGEPEEASRGHRRRRKDYAR